MGEVILDIVEEISNFIGKKQGNVHLDGNIVPVSSENFHKLEKLESNKKIVFIDGGNAELFSAADFSLHFVRTCGLIFKNNKKIDSIKEEFYVLVNAVEEKGKLMYKAKIFSLKGKNEEIAFNSDDQTLKDGVNRSEISKIGNIVRRFAELTLANKVIDKADIVVLDGSLKTSIVGESVYMQRIYDKAIEKNVIISSLCKTNRIFTDKGGCFISQLETDFDQWYYHPVIELNNKKHQAELSFVKLNKSSEYVFCFEIFKNQKENLKEILSMLANNSNDAVFPGYPYGLILADKFARVSNEEREYLLTVFQAKSGKLWEQIKKQLSVVNAHSILDNIS